MKKTVSLMLIIAMIFSLCSSVFANETRADIELTEFWNDVPANTVGIKGTVNNGEGERTVSIRVVEAGKSFEEALKNTYLLQHLFMVKTDVTGNFEYEFELFRKGLDDTGIFDIYITADCSECIIKKTISCNWSVDYNYIAENSIIFNRNNKNAIVYGNNFVMDKAPMLKDSKVYIDAGFAISMGIDKSATVNIDGTEYINISEFENKGNKIYIGNDIFAVSTLDGITPIDILKVLFGKGSIVLNEFWGDAQTGKVRISGTASGSRKERCVMIRVVEAGQSLDEVQANPQLLQHLYMVKTNADGEFEYEFTINSNSGTGGEVYDIYINAQKTDSVIKKTISCYSGDSLEYVTGDSMIFYKGNKNAIVNGTYETMRYAPIEKNGTLYVDEAFAQSKGMSGYTPCIIEGISYVDADEFGKNIYHGNEVYIVSDKSGITNADAFKTIFGLYVSPYGNDDNDGSFGAPVQTVNKALELAERNRFNGECRIFVEDGEYCAQDTIKLENISDIKIVNYADDKPIISGAVKLLSGDFETVTDTNVLSKLKVNLSGKLMSLDLSKYGINPEEMKNLGDDSYYRLYANGKKQTLARYPNSEYENIVMAGSSFSDGFFMGENSTNWSNVENISFAGFVNNAFQLIKGFAVSKIEDTGAFILPSAFDSTWNLTGRACNAVNVFEELDVPGEWYIDAENKTLYYYPAGKLDDVELSIFNGDMISVSDSQNVEIKGFELKNTNSNGIVISESKNVSIDGVKLHSVGKRGASVTGSENSVIKNSEIYDIGRDGVYINCGNRPNLKDGNCGAENCHIYSFSKRNYNMSGVNLNGCGNYAKHNVIHDSISQAVWVGGNSHIADNNEMYNVVRDVHDAGAVYCGGMGGQIGNQITNNYIHDVNKGKSQISGIYLDDGFSGTTVKGNIIANVTDWGLFGGGRNNTITNNLIFDSNQALYDTRMEWGNFHRTNSEKYGWKGIVPLIINKEQYPDYDEDKWTERYGDMWTSIVEDTNKDYNYRQGTSEEEFDAGLPRYVNITDNLVISHNKSVSLSPVGLNWHTKSPNNSKVMIPKEGYMTVYENNLGILRKTPYSVNESEMLDYTVSRSNYYIMLDTREIIEPGELYQITAEIYGKKVQSAASAKIASASNVGSNWWAYPFTLYFDGNGEQQINQDGRTEVTCYWIPHGKDNSSASGSLIKISFPKSSVGDIYSIGNVEFKKVMYSDVRDKIPAPTMEEAGAGEYKYPPVNRIDISETESLLKVGSTTKVKAYSIEEEFTENTTDEDSRTTADEIKLVPTELTEGLTYTSSDTSVAEVDENGNITAKTEGFATITATDGTDSASVMITCYTDRYTGMRFNGSYSSVHDYDPVYSGEAIRPMGTEGGFETGVTAKDGVKISFKFYDNGALADKLMSSENLCFGIKSGSKLDGFGGAGCLSISDQYGDGRYKFASMGNIGRSAGWHQVYGVMKPSGTDGSVHIEWYLDGKKYVNSSDILVGEKVYLYHRVHNNSYPQWFKNVYVVGESSVYVGVISESVHAENTVINAASGESSAWSTESDTKLISIYENNRAIKTDDYMDWFADIDNKDFTIVAEDELAEAMPQFEQFDFKAMGNTTEIYSGLPVPDLWYPINRQQVGKTVNVQWSESAGASEYVLKISRNADMSDTIITKTVNVNNAAVSLPENGVYYYTVTAKNLSKDYGCESVSDIQSFYVSNELVLTEIKIEEVSDTMNKADFEYSVSNVKISGKAILAEKSNLGKTVNIDIEDIPEAIDNKITVSAVYGKENIMECYLWSDIRLMKPYIAKATTVGK